MNLVFLHGFCETKSIWDTFTDSLSDSYRCTSLDLAGFGSNLIDLPENVSMQVLAEDVIKQIKDQSIEKPVIIGHSLGGYVALEIMRIYPDILSGIVLFHSTAFPDGEEKKQNREKTIRFVRKYGIEAFANHFAPSLFHDKQHPKIEWLHRLTCNTSIDTFYKVTRAMKNRKSYTEVLKTARQEIPIHYILGQKDGFIQTRREIEYINSCTGVSYDLIENCAHIGMIESPNTCKGSLTGFLEKIHDFLFE